MTDHAENCNTRRLRTTHDIEAAGGCNCQGPVEEGTMVDSLGHDWECIAPEGGFYRWHCKNCFASRPYPDPNPLKGERCPTPAKNSASPNPGSVMPCNEGTETPRGSQKT
jgi:hypothetical protein